MSCMTLISKASTIINRSLILNEISYLKMVILYVKKKPVLIA